ncbi:hypothetical protein AGDE_14310 [Angomonas deanei]|uniref:Uncharacterized protein n=1 Tax=Angomonas deanei TaxID=59799 RepID=A0A7G2CL59_9TRYP|nr:hypothetical protein AGDE_14310 [Angomonas deanei]CAD2219654.1 hypothetical protein, conserved [Angomonas deanei]|eukprot:EPY21072.1 hypothetical protein AGDE_14310 [Angomonas deanei]
MSASAFDPDSVDLIMRDKPSQFTDEEIGALATMEMADPSPEELEMFLKNREANTLVVIEDSDEGNVEKQWDRTAAEATKEAESEQNTENFYAKRPVSSYKRPSSRPGTRPRSGTASGRRKSLTGGTDNNMKKEHIFSVLTKSDIVGDTDLISEAVLKVKNVELVERGLTSTLVAETFLNATHLYLQHNSITELDGLQLLAHLKVLVVHHNKVETVQPLALLDNLMYLDASDNCIATVQAEWDFPTNSLEYLDLQNNPCVPSDKESYATFAAKICDAVPNLKYLNEVSLASDSSEDEEEGEKETTAVSSEARPRVRLQQTLLDAKDAQSFKNKSNLENTEKTRLLSQFENRSKAKRELTRKVLTENEKTPGTEEDVVLGDFLGRELEEARHMHSKMYGDIMFASEVTQDRLVRSLEEQWDGVAKVVQSRHAAVSERRRRLQEKSAQSEAYKEGLQLLLQEARCEDADAYRKKGEEKTPASPTA